MSKSPLFWWLIFIFCITLASNSSKASDEFSKIDPILITVAQRSTSKLDFEILFTNWLQEFHPNTEVAKASHDKFLDAFIKYKLLTNKVENFFKGKTHSLANKFEIYFLEKATSRDFFREIEEQVIREAFIRSHYMIDADHILLAFDESDNEKSKSAIYDKALKLKDQHNQNKNAFEQIVSRHSDDKYSNDNNGKIGLFTVFEQIYPVESVAYGLDINSISKPVKSRFGYHLIRTRNKIKMSGLKNVSHILIKSDIDDAHAEKEISEIYSKITTKNFSNLAGQHSHDFKTAIKGGELGTDRLIYDLELKKHKLEEGSISKPFRSKFGWHIMTVNELEEFKPYWQQRSHLKEMIQFDSRIQRVIDSAKSDNIYKPMQEIKQLHWENFLTLNYLKKIDPDIQLGDLSELELINMIVDSKLSINFSKLKQRYPVKVNTEVLQLLFN